MSPETTRLHNIKDNFKAILFGALTVTLIAAGITQQSIVQNQKSEVLGISLLDSVTVSATVEACFLRIRVHPEKRIPATGNWGTTMDVDVYDDTNTLVASFNTSIDDAQGLSPQIDMCTLMGTTPDVGQYVLRIKALSHLRNRFPAVTIFNQLETVVNLVPLEPPLLAGETSIIFDNFINGLDLSTQVNELYTGNNKNDLNQDGIVNSLDLSNSIFNLYVFGEN